MRIPRLSLRLAMVPVVLVAVGCSSDDDDSAVSSFINEYCSLMMPCCTAAGKSADPTDCKLLLGYAAGKGAYNTAQGEACLKSLREVTQNGTVCPSSSTPSDASCDAVFTSSSTGTAQPGQTCEQDSDCAKAATGTSECLYSSSGAGEPAQKCYVMLEGSDGSTPCIAEKKGTMTSYFNLEGNTQGYVCDRDKGFMCDSQSKACKALAQPGGDCTSDMGCVATAWCNYSEKKCAERVGVGAECKTSSSQCESTAYCGTDKTCVAKGDAGSPCTGSQQCKSERCVADVCKAAEDMTTGLLCGD